MNAFSKRLKGTMSSYFDAGKDSASATAPPTAVFLTEVPNGAMDLALEDDAATLGKKRGLERRPTRQKLGSKRRESDEPPKSGPTSSPRPRGNLLADTSKRDAALEEKVMRWITGILHVEPTADYEHFIRDGSVLSKVMTSIVFNSVPIEDIDVTWGCNPSLNRIKAVIREIRRYGVQDVFEVEDLLELRNITKVTKCLAQLSKLAASDKENLLNCMV